MTASGDWGLMTLFFKHQPEQGEGDDKPAKFKEAISDVRGKTLPDGRQSFQFEGEHITVPHRRVHLARQSQGRIHDFGQGGTSGAFIPERVLSPNFSQNCPKTA